MPPTNLKLGFCEQARDSRRTNHTSYTLLHYTTLQHFSSCCYTSLALQQPETLRSVGW